MESGRQAGESSGVQLVLGRASSRSPRKGPSRQAKVLENLAGDGGREDARYDSTRAAALVARQDVYCEGLPEQLGPGDAVLGGRSRGRAGRRHGRGWDSGHGGKLLGWLGDEVLTQARVGRKEAEEADQVDAGRGNEGGEATEEFEGLEDELGLAGGGGTLHAVGEAAIGQPREALET